MALLKTTLLLVLFCLAQGVPEFKTASDLGLELALSVVSNTTVSGDKQQDLAKVNLWLSVYGDYNGTDNAVVNDFVHQKLSSLQIQNEDDDVEMERTLMPARNGLPLLFNLTFTESISVGPHPVKRFFVTLNLDVYANSKHRNHTMAVVNKLKPTF